MSRKTKRLTKREKKRAQKRRVYDHYASMYPSSALLYPSLDPPVAWYQADNAIADERGRVVMMPNLAGSNGDLVPPDDLSGPRLVVARDAQGWLKF